MSNPVLFTRPSWFVRFLPVGLSLFCSVGIDEDDSSCSGVDMKDTSFVDDLSRGKDGFTVSADGFSITYS